VLVNTIACDQVHPLTPGFGFYDRFWWEAAESRGDDWLAQATPFGGPVSEVVTDAGIVLVLQLLPPVPYHRDAASALERLRKSIWKFSP
jgi:hypothetical protein